MKEITKKDRILRTTTVFSFNPERMKLINEKRFAEVRDYWAHELEQLDKERQLALETSNRSLLEDVLERYRHALRMYDRYYVLADLQKKGVDKPYAVSC